MRHADLLALALALLVATGALAQTTQEAVLGGAASPAVLFDGREISHEDLAGFEATQIGDIRILSGERAMAEFGKYGEHGVIVVTGAARTSVADADADRTLDAAPAAEEPLGEVWEQVTFVGGDPYIVIDGRPATNAEMQALDPERIAAINVLKGAAAEAKYGASGKGGVIEVTTKG